MPTVTRFAPSPTGMLHIGGARTALFNYLFARRNHGKFLLRIEDTDRARSTQEAVDAILAGLDWLGLVPDEDPVFQSVRADRHAACAEEMIEKGAAFRCYVTSEQLAARREAGEQKRAEAKSEDLSDEARAQLRAEAEELLAPFRSPWRDGGTPPGENAPHVVRLRAPDDGEIVLSDQVLGEITLKAHEIDDLILLRADGTPTYMLAVVADDHDMGVTHVIRGDDHLRNTFRQIPIYQAMDWPLPNFAHVPMIHGQDGAKLSKRHGALSTMAYRDMGYLPEALNAYLLRLGWAHGDQEIFTMDEAADVFSLEEINSSPGRLDLDKLGAVNAHFIRLCENERLFGLLKPWLADLGVTDEAMLTRVRTALPDLKDRGSTLGELAEAMRFLWSSNADNHSKKARKALNGDGLERLRGLRDRLADLAIWDTDNLHGAIEAYCDAQSLGMGQVGPPLRAALTGGLPAPDLAPVMDWLGRTETLERIDEQLARAPAGGDTT